MKNQNHNNIDFRKDESEWINTNSVYKAAENADAIVILGGMLKINEFENNYSIAGQILHDLSIPCMIYITTKIIDENAMSKSIGTFNAYNYGVDKQTLTVATKSVVPRMERVSRTTTRTEHTITQRRRNRRVRIFYWFYYGFILVSIGFYCFSIGFYWFLPPAQIRRSAGANPAQIRRSVDTPGRTPLWED